MSLDPRGQERLRSEVFERSSAGARNRIVSGRSENGYLSVSLTGGQFGSLRVKIDEVWLHAASVQKIEQAMREAIVAEDVTAGATAWKVPEFGSSLEGLVAGNTWPEISGLDSRDLSTQSKW